MAIRNDFSFDMESDPRIITVQAPSAEATVQDIHDSCVAYSDSNAGMVFSTLIESAGKEPLGGSVSVGITATLQNAQLQFEGRTTAIESGSVTTADSVGTTLKATGGLFVTNNIERGYTIFNATTGAMATVLEVVSEIELISQLLSGGSRNDWQITDTYICYENIQCNISGGNLVAEDSNGSPISPVLQSPNVNIVRTSSSSATLASQEALEAALFSEGVIIDILAGLPGTNGTIGSREFPSNNITDALVIAQTRGLRTLTIISSMTIATEDLSYGYKIIGDHPSNVVLTLSPAADLTNCQFFNIQISGEIDGANVIEHSALGTVTGCSGFVFQTVLGNSITLSGQTIFMQCFAGEPGIASSVISINGNNIMIVRDFSGSLTITNSTGPADHTIHVNGGSVTFDSSVTDGDFYVRGSLSHPITDNSTGTARVIDQTSTTLVSERFDNIHKLLESQRNSHQAYGTVFFWDPVNGDDASDGLSEAKAKLTFASVEAEVTAFRGDVIFAINGNPSGVTTVTTPIKMTKQRTSLRGPGRAFYVSVNDATVPAVWMNAEGCSVEGLAIRQADIAQPGLYQDKAGCLIKNVIVDNCAGNGVEITGTALAPFPITPVNIIENLESLRSGGHALYIHDDVGLTFIKQGTHLEESSGDGLRMENNVNDVHLMEVIIHENAGYGINLINPTVTNTTIIDPRYVLNTLGDLNDNGVDTANVNPGVSVVTNPKTLTVPKFLGLK